MHRAFSLFDLTYGEGFFLELNRNPIFFSISTITKIAIECEMHP